MRNTVKSSIFIRVISYNITKEMFAFYPRKNIIISYTCKILKSTLKRFDFKLNNYCGIITYKTSEMGWVNMNVAKRS